MKRSVLIVEDDASVRDILRSALEREYNVLEASGCSEAASLLGNPIDIALIDYILPDGNAFDVLKAIRKVKPELPIIVMTAYSTEGLVIRALRAGATEYVKKPLVLAHLRKMISNILEGKKEDELAENLGYGEDFILDGIAAFMEDNYSDDITLDQLAEKVCMNKYKFSKVFNERFGQNIRAYLARIRVKKGAELLKNRDLRIADIAFSVGFGSVEHFIRSFEKIYGVTPKEYRINPTKACQEGCHLWDLD